MNFNHISQSFQAKIAELFPEIESAITQREDSRAFGAMIEKRIAENWKNLCKELGYKPIALPGRRTIWDFAAEVEGILFGFDVKTKDLDSAKYSDGGVCAVSNLLKFMANDKGVFMIVEFGHTDSGDESGNREIEYVSIAPFHTLPTNTYRIENLGTGQVRLNYTVNQVWSEIRWQRTYKKFFDIFCNLALTHYKRVKSDADKRIKSILKFKAGGYKHFKLVRN